MSEPSSSDLRRYLEQGASAPDSSILSDRKTIQIARSASDVWALAGNFGELSWFPAAKGVTVTDGNHLGSQRLIDFGGPKLLETLIAYDAIGRSYTYAIDDTPENRQRVPASDFKGRLGVEDDGLGGSIATWEGVCRRADPGPMPAKGSDDEAARAHMQRTFSAGLAALKASAEAS